MSPHKRHSASLEGELCFDGSGVPRCERGAQREGTDAYCTTHSLERLELYIHSGTNTVAQVPCVGDQRGSYHCSLLMNAGMARLGRRLADQILYPATRAPEPPRERVARCLAPCRELTHLPKECPVVLDLGRAVPRGPEGQRGAGRAGERCPAGLAAEPHAGADPRAGRQVKGLLWGT